MNPESDSMAGALAFPLLSQFPTTTGYWFARLFVCNNSRVNFISFALSARSQIRPNSGLISQIAIAPIPKTQITGFFSLPFTGFPYRAILESWRRFTYHIRLLLSSNSYL